MLRLRRWGLYSLCLTVGFLYCTGKNASAQQVFGSIFGTVTDANGGVVPNAKVTITDMAKGTTTELATDASGNYSKGQLIPDEYRVTIQDVAFHNVDSRPRQVR